MGTKVNFSPRMESEIVKEIPHAIIDGIFIHKHAEVLADFSKYKSEKERVKIMKSYIVELTPYKDNPIVFDREYNKLLNMVTANL